MKKKIVLLTLVSVFLLSAVIGSQLIVSVAAVRTVGVSKGDWIEYYTIWSGNGSMPSPGDRGVWGKITVLEVSGTNITFEKITLFADATEETTIHVIDVDTGKGNDTLGFFIAKNLNESDLIYTSPPPPQPPIEIPFQDATINETIWGTYPVVGYVEVNHWNITIVDGSVSTSFDYCWFRATGMIASFSLYQQVQLVEGYEWVKIESVIIDIFPEFPPALILPLFMIATLAAVWLGKTIWSTKKLIKKTSPCA